MGFMDDIYKGTKKAVGSVEKFAGNTVEYSKLKISLAGLNEKLEKKYVELGKIAYGSLETGSDLKQTSLHVIEDIKLLISQINEKNEILSKLKSEKVCTSCGSKNNEKATYCIKCGNKLD